MAGRSAGATITRYAGLQVQTSALGVNIPVGWGTFRCKCNLVDYLDFKSVAQKSGGKGGSTTTGYSYYATVILAVCEGPVDAISTVYVDSKVYTNGSKTALARAGLSFSAGAVGQAVWSYLTSKHPAHAIGYSGLAIVYASNYALGSSAQTPNHSFEVVRTSGFGVSGSPDADPSLVVADFFQNSRTGVPSWPSSGLLGPLTQYQNYCLAAGLLVSPVIDSQRSASDFLTELLLATNSTCVWSEGVLKFIPYGDTALSGNGKTYTPAVTPVYALGDDYFIVDNPGDAPLQVDIMDQSDAYNVVQLEYLDRTNQYNMAIALASDAANVAQYGMRRKDPDTVHCICTPAVAAISAQLFLQRTLYVRAQYKFKLGWMFAILEPGDIVELTDAGLGLNAYPVRIVQIDEDEQYGLEITAEDAQIGVANAPLYTMQTGSGYAVNQGVDPGGVEANLLLWSGDISNAAWTLTNATVTAGAATDQYGLSTAPALKASAVSGVHSVGQGVSTFDGVAYTYAVCLQAATHKNARVTLADAAGANGAYVEVDASAGAILTVGTALGAGVLVSASLNATLVSGIWQVVVTVQVPGATTLYGSVSLLSDAGALSWTGDAAAGLYVSQQAIRQGVAAGTYAATTSAAAGPYLFNPPSSLTNGQHVVWAAVAGGPNWGGCNVWASIDGTSYQEIGTVDAPCAYGVATTSLASHADPDTTDSLGVDLGVCGGALSSASATAADNGATLSLIDGELICFETATLTNPSRYTLGTYIRRGYLNSTIAAHSAGAPFVRLDAAVFEFPYLATNAGQTVYVKFQSFNLWGEALQDLADCVAYSVVPNPVGVTAPGASAWTAVATTLANAGQSVPAIHITGASDNASATGVVFYYRITGGGSWISAGVHATNITVFDITSVTPGSSYDVGVAYVVGGVVGSVQIVATGLAVGTLSTGGSADGTVLYASSTAGSGSFTVPSGSYGNVSIQLAGADGGNLYNSVTGVTTAGGAGGSLVRKILVTPGSTTISFSLGTVGTGGGSGVYGGTPSGNGGVSTVSAYGLAANGGYGTNGSYAGGNATGGDANTTGATSGGSGRNGSITIIAKT
jgi:hypothetical protein